MNFGIKKDIDELILRLTGYEGKHGHGHYHHGEVEKNHPFYKEILREDKSRLEREMKQLEEDKKWMEKEISNIEKKLKD